ncbi:MAG: NUDIX hydrolase [Myxococcales bacterium]|nr:NUDIX hydrolase [Myxococcales bacterium]
MIEPSAPESAASGQKVYPRPSLTADVVLLRYRDGWLQVLLIERKRPPFAGRFALPGGFVDEGEAPIAAAARELREETGVEGVPLYEVGAFGEAGRDPRGWVVSVAFLGLATPDCWAQAGDDAAALGWHRLTKLPEMAFDHAQIIERALGTLRQRLQVDTTALQLLPPGFRTVQARHLYSQILGEPIAPTPFKAWLRRRGAVERLGPARFARAASLRPDWQR